MWIAQSSKNGASTTLATEQEDTEAIARPVRTRGTEPIRRSEMFGFNRKATPQELPNESSLQDQYMSLVNQARKVHTKQDNKHYQVLLADMRARMTQEYMNSPEYLINQQGRQEANIRAAAALKKAKRK